MLRLPPRSTLFPYTTSSDLADIAVEGVDGTLDLNSVSGTIHVVGTPQDVTAETMRSEEHTSELQSHSDLVCRLLLEKKKRKPLWRLMSCHSVVTYHVH